MTALASPGAVSQAGLAVAPPGVGGYQGFQSSQSSYVDDLLDPASDPSYGDESKSAKDDTRDDSYWDTLVKTFYAMIGEDAKGRDRKVTRASTRNILGLVVGVMLVIAGFLSLALSFLGTAGPTVLKVVKATA